MLGILTFLELGILSSGPDTINKPYVLFTV